MIKYPEDKLRKHVPLPQPPKTPVKETPKEIMKPVQQEKPTVIKVEKPPKPLKTKLKPQQPSWVEIDALKRLISRVRKKENRCPSLNGIRRRKMLTSKLHKLLESSDEVYDRRLSSLNGHTICSKIFNYMKEFDLFVRLFCARLDTQWTPEPQFMNETLSGVKAKDHSMCRTSGSDKEPMFAWRFISLVQSKTKILNELLGIIEKFDLVDQRVEDFYVVSTILHLCIAPISNI